MVNSMTGYASRTGALAPFSWSWDLRSVNGRGLDLRLRVPDWVPGLESALRGQLTKAMARGSVNLSLRVQRDEAATGMAVDTDQLGALLATLGRIGAEAEAQGVHLDRPSTLDVLTYRGIVQSGDADGVNEALTKTLVDDFAPLLSDFLAARASEGKALQATLAGHVDQIETLTAAARAAADDRAEATAQKLRRNLALVLDNTEGADPDRVAQELALIAVKADVNEELDRLSAHIAAARALLAQDGPVGRKLDFLTQEFNREANTLCSKSGSSELTRIGLDLKAVIDQMREQVQNAE
ncbi:MAG: YicC/YloC family endoribonuclease [Brevirhabdus sp.]